MASAGFSVTLAQDHCQLDPLYVLALVNSKLLFWNLRTISSKFRGGWVTCTKQYFGSLPIRLLDLDNEEDRARHGRAVESARRMLALQAQLSAAKTGHEKTAIERQIAATDRQIDRLVYELYELTDEEIRIVEAAHAG
jgi:hypothetical protein